MKVVTVIVQEYRNGDLTESLRCIDMLLKDLSNKTIDACWVTSAMKNLLDHKEHSLMHVDEESRISATIKLED